MNQPAQPEPLLGIPLGLAQKIATYITQNPSPAAPVSQALEIIQGLQAMGPAVPVPKRTARQPPVVQEGDNGAAKSAPEGVEESQQEAAEAPAQ